MTQAPTLRDASCADDYDPNSMPVDKARALIARFLTPLTATERVHVRSALGRVLAQDVISPVNVPPHDNSAMDGYAFAGHQLLPKTPLKLNVVGTAFAGKAWRGAVNIGAGPTPQGISLTQAPSGGLASTPTQGLFVGSLVAPAFNLGSLSATIQLLESFGNVRVLSSPKMSVLNNQTALLKVVDNVVYFEIQAQTTTSTVEGRSC